MKRIPVILSEAKDLLTVLHLLRLVHPISYAMNPIKAPETVCFRGFALYLFDLSGGLDDPALHEQGHEVDLVHVGDLRGVLGESVFPLGQLVIVHGASLLCRRCWAKRFRITQRVHYTPCAVENPLKSENEICEISL